MKLWGGILFLITMTLLGNKENIDLYLKWRHSFQFAGYYAAEKQGFYEEAGLSVRIIENNIYDRNRVEKILQKENSYGVATPKALLNKKNKEMQILSVIFQHSPIVLLTLKDSNITTPQDFIDKRYLGEYLFAELMVMLSKEGVHLARVKKVARKGNAFKKLINKEIDIIPGYITTLPYRMQKLGIDFNMIRPVNYGVDFYGDFLFTNKKEVQNHPKRVEKFIQASLKGWEYAMTHKDEMIVYIMKEYNSDMSYDELFNEADIMEKSIVMSKFIEVGHMNIGRWKYIERVLKSLNLIDSHFDIRTFIYTKKEKSILENHYVNYLIYAIFIITFIALVSFLFNLQLKRKVNSQLKNIAEKEERFQVIFNNNFQFNVVLNPLGQVLLVNHSALSIIDKKIEAIKGSFYWDTPWFEHSVKAKEVVKKSIQAEMKKQSFVRFETTHRGVGGKLYVIDLSIKKIKYNNQKENYFLVEGRDITTYKTIEQKINNSQKMEAIGVLAGGIAHDFNNIIGAIIGYAELIKLNIKDEDDAYKVKQIINASMRAKKLVSRIITFSKGIDESKSYVNIIPLIDGIINLSRPVIKSDKVNIEVEYLKNASIYGVYTQIEQVVMNILRNALQAITEEGSVSILVDTIDTTSNIILFDSILPIGKYLKISIADNGPGIKKENLNRVFDPYFSTKNKKDGTGLGLFVVHGIINKHGAYIDVASEEGEGTVFDLYFPIAGYDFDVQKSNDKKYVAVQNSHGKQIMLVDDEEMIVDSLSKVLVKKGYKVDCFTDPVKALQFFREHRNRYDLLITDQSMPELTGIELVTQIKEIKPQLPVILCSGYNNIVNESNVNEYHIDEYLEKPIMFNKLISVMNYLLSKDV